MLPSAPPSLLQPLSLLYVPGTCSLAPILLPLLAPRPPNVSGLVSSQARLSTAPLQRKSSLITQSEVAHPSAPSLQNLPAAASPHHPFPPQDLGSGHFLWLECFSASSFMADSSEGSGLHTSITSSERPRHQSLMLSSCLISLHHIHSLNHFTYLLSSGFFF